MSTNDDQSVSVALTKEANRAWDTYCRETGLKKRAALKRLVEWFAQQDRTLQSLILGMFSEQDKANVLELLLARQREAPDAAMAEDVETAVRDSGVGRTKKRGRRPAG